MEPMEGYVVLYCKFVTNLFNNGFLSFFPIVTLISCLFSCPRLEQRITIPNDTARIGPPADRYVDRPLLGGTIDLGSHRMIRGCIRW